MRYYLDCEFDGHNGPLLSIALVREDGFGMHVRTTARADDPWVMENVEPLMDMHKAEIDASNVRLNDVGEEIRRFLVKDDGPIIIADSIVDIARFCRSLSTGGDGEWAYMDGDIKFEVSDVSAYPTALPGAVQHNAWWDAMALRHKLQEALGALDGETLP